MCLPCRMIRNPAFSRARTASMWLTPGIRANAKPPPRPRGPRHLQSGPRGRQVLADGILNADERLFLGVSLGPATGQGRNGNTDSLVGAVHGNSVFHLSPPAQV